MINKHLSKIGTHGIPCSAYQYWAFRIKNNTGYLLSSLHRGLYHCTCGIKRNIKARRSLEPNHLHTLLDFTPDLTRLLQFFHSILYTAFHIDASISIYRISETSDERLVLTREIFLMSKTEESKANMRQQNHKYLIAREPANSIKELASKAQLYCEHHGNAMFQKTVHLISSFQTRRISGCQMIYRLISTEENSLHRVLIIRSFINLWQLLLFYLLSVIKTRMPA